MPQRRKTIDREASPVLTAEQIGEKRHRTPEGFLLCLDVPIARVGEMIYGPGEIPIEPGPDGISRVSRDEQALFDPAAIASYTAKPVVNEHPEDEDVTPKNWKALSVGVVLNPRRGTGDDSDVMLADLLITDAEAIRDVESGKREVSAGYEADYEQIAPGRGRQTNIRGNHVALVERGRCGPRCAIGDHQPKELHSMPTPNPRRTKLADRIRNVFKDAAEELATTLPDDLAEGEKDTHVHIHMNGEKPVAAAEGVPSKDDDPVEMRFQSLERGHQEIKDQLAQLMSMLSGTKDEADKPGEVEKDGPAGSNAQGGGDPDVVKMFDGMPEEVEAAMSSKTNDSAALETHFRNVISDAEVLLPGYQGPTFDPKAKRKATMDSMCGMRRAVLTQLIAKPEGAELINSVSSSPIKTFDGMACAAVASVFRAAAGAQRAINNRAGTADAGRLPRNGFSASAPKITPAKLNEMNRKYYGAQ